MGESEGHNKFRLTYSSGLNYIVYMTNKHTGRKCTKHEWMNWGDQNLNLRCDKCGKLATHARVNAVLRAKHQNSLQRFDLRCAATQEVR